VATALLLAARTGEGAALFFAFVLMFVVVIIARLVGRRSPAGLAMRAADLLLRGDEARAEAMFVGLEASVDAEARARAARLLVERALPAPDPLADDDELSPELDPGVREVAQRFARRAMQDAPRNPRVLEDVARAHALVGAEDDSLDAIRGALDLDDVPVETLSDLGALSLDFEAWEEAHALYARARALRPDAHDLACGEAEALLALERPAEALALLDPVMHAIRRLMDRMEWYGPEAEALSNRLFALHDDAASRARSREKAIDTHVATGMLDAHAGVNYRLMALSMLVDTDRPPRRVILPDTKRLRADAASLLAKAPDRADGHEDLGLARLREGDLDGAEAELLRALELDAAAWPAMAGLGLALDQRKTRTRDWLRGAIAAPTPPGLERLVDDWSALTDDERRIIALAFAAVPKAADALAAAGGRLHIVSLDARLTDLPAFAQAAGVRVEDDDDARMHDAIEGMCTGVTFAVRVDALLTHEGDGWTVAHELGHALLNLAADDVIARVEALYERALETSWLSTEYGLTNAHELFATGFERFALRHAFPDAPRDEVHAADVTLGVDGLLRDVVRGYV
jgi:tetratricopeptide (TPR) repeat protein